MGFHRRSAKTCLCDKGWKAQSLQSVKTITREFCGMDISLMKIIGIEKDLLVKASGLGARILGLDL